MNLRFPERLRLLAVGMLKDLVFASSLLSVLVYIYLPGRLGLRYAAASQSPALAAACSFFFIFFEVLDLKILGTHIYYTWL